MSARPTHSCANKSRFCIQIFQLLQLISGDFHAYPVPVWKYPCGAYKMPDKLKRAMGFYVMTVSSGFTLRACVLIKMNLLF